MSGAFTLVVGPGLRPLAEQLAGGAALAAPEDRCADAFTRSVLRALFRVHLGKHAVLHLAGAGPQLSPHQRRSLERVAQGARPAVVLQGGAAPPPWAACLPRAYAGLDQPGAFPEAAGASALAWPPGAGLASSEAARAFLEGPLAALRPANPGAGTGSWRPGGALLVGDRPNPRSAGAGCPPWPFISQLREGCSAWLSEQLEAAGVPEARLYWVNAFTRAGEANGALALLAQQLATRLVVALGKRAADALSREGVPHHQVHHPQHWKRFHHHHAYVLGRVLRRGLAR